MAIHNNQNNATITIKMSPSEALISFEIPLYPDQCQGTNNDTIEDYVN